MAINGKKTLAVVFSLVLVVGGIAWFSRPPTYGQAKKIVRGPVLAYHVWDDKPHLLFISTDYYDNYEKVIYVHLELNWISFKLPPIPRWQLSGAWYSIPYTETPASLGAAHCTGVYYFDCNTYTEVFGQINSHAITSLELNFKGKWHLYQVSYPGFALRLEGFREKPSDYHWLDSQGRVIWAAKQDTSVTKPADHPGEDWNASN